MKFEIINDIEWTIYQQVCYDQNGIIDGWMDGGMDGWTEKKGRTFGRMGE